MTIIDKIKDLLRMLAENIHKRRKVVLALSCVVVFVTTYMLILPAFTLEKTKAAEQGGIDVPGVTATAEDVSEDEEANEAGQADAQDVQTESGKTEDGKVEDSGSKSKDSGEAKADSAQTEDPLTYEDEHYTIAVDDKNSVLPENTEIKVEEIDKNEDAKKYQKHFDDALAAIQEEKDGENVSDLEFARFYDISLVSDGKEVTLGNGDKVSVNIEYDKELRKALGVENKDNIRIIHFAENKDTGKVEAEVLDNKEAKVEVNTDKKDQLKEASFEAESFSVYAVVYTVDFDYEDEATHEVYKYSMEGGSSITLKKLAVILGITAKDKADEFIANVEDVKFSDEKLVKVEKTDNGWTLKSLKAFDTTEALTITMKDGSVYEVKVTDATAPAETDVALAPFITDATLEIDGKTYGAGETWKVRPDVDYKLTLTFTEKGSRQLPPGGSTLVMDLPVGLTLEPGAHGSFDIPCGLAGTVTGNTWSVDSNGKLHIQLGNDPDDLLTRSSNVHINLELDAKFDGTHTQFDFNDKVKREVEYDNSASASVTKSGHYNASTNKMEYTLTVKSTGATEKIKVTDAFSGNMLSLDENSITVNPSSKTITSQNTNNKGFDLTISEMSHNETVTINYTASVDLSKVGPGGKVEPVDGTNNVTVKPENGDGDNDKNIVNTIKYSSISKSSTGQSAVEGDDTKVKLDWTIVANKGSKGSLAGSKITDTIDWGSKDVMKYASKPLELTIKVYNQDGTPAGSPRTASVDVTDNQGQESWTYVIPDSDKSNNYYYEISYSTIADKKKENLTVKNNVDNESDGNSSGSGLIPGTNPSGGGDNPDGLVVTKTAKNVTEKYVDWDIVINVPAEGFDSLDVTDILPWQYKGNFSDNDFADRLVGEPTVTGLEPGETYSWNSALYSNGQSYPNGAGQAPHLTKDGKPLGVEVVTLKFFKDAGKTQPGLKNVARTVTITIRTENDEKWLEHAAGKGGNYYNTHTNNAIINNAKVSADAKPVKSYVRKSLVEKKDTLDGVVDASGNKIPGPYYYYDIMVSNVTEEPIVIEDTFDKEILEFVDLSKYQNSYKDAYFVGHGMEDYQFDTSDRNTPTYELTDNGIKITATNLVKQPDKSYYPFYHVRYYLRLKDGASSILDQRALANGGTYKIGNTAKWGDNTDHYDVDYNVPGLTKEGYFKKSGVDRTYTFLIDVNPKKFTMNGGSPMDLADSHTDNLSVDYTTIKVYKITDGAVETDPKKYDLSKYETVNGEVTWDFEGNTGTFTVPDKTHYLITYDALVIGSKVQEFSNIAEMKGFSSTKTDKRDFGSDSSAGGDVMQIKLLKHMKDQTSEGLSGATFQLFRGTGEYTMNEDGSYKEEIKEPMKYGDTKYTRGEANYDNGEYSFSSNGKNVVGHNITFTTNSDGWVTMALNQSVHGEMFEEGVHYYLKEIDSPPGYQIDSSVEYWEFTLTKDPDGVSYGTTRDPETGWRQWIYFYYNDILKMSNTPTKNPIDVNVNKQWFDENGVEITDDRLNDLEASIQLMRKKNDEEYQKVKVTTGTDGEPVIEEVEDDSGIVTLNRRNNWAYSWENLPRVDGSDKYAYKVEEVNVSGYVVDVTETEDETTKTYALKNYKIPEDRNTDITVEKKWQDYSGNDLAGTEETIPELIHYYIYQVVSSTPFTSTPKTGGSIYVIPNDPRLVDRTATDTDDNYGMYFMTKGTSEPYWRTTFENLPEVVTDNKGNTFYYAYYIKEVEDEAVKDYTTTYVVDGATRTIVNREPRPKGEYIDIGLEKKWTDTDGVSTNPPDGASATFTLHQQKSTKSGDSAGNLTVNLVDSDKTTILATRKANVGDTVSFTANMDDGTHRRILVKRVDSWNQTNYGDVGGIQGPGEVHFSYTISSNDTINNTVTIVVGGDDADFSTHCTSGPTWDAGEPSYSDYEDTNVTQTINLPYGYSWSYNFKNLVQEDADGNLYRYYITEDSCSPSATNVTFKDSDGNDIKDPNAEGNQSTTINTDKQKVIVTNTYSPSLDVIKLWKDSSSQYTDWQKDITIVLHKDPVSEGAASIYTYKVNWDNTNKTGTVESTDSGIVAPTARITEDTTSDGYRISFPTLKGGYKYYVTEEAVDGCKAPSYGHAVSSTDAGTPRIEENTGADARKASNGQYITNAPEDAVELPHTGGIGTVIFYVLGSILVIGGGIYFISRRRAMK